MKKRLVAALVCMLLPLLVVVLVTYVAFNDLLTTLETVTRDAVTEAAPIADLEDLVEEAEHLLYAGLRHPQQFDRDGFAELVLLIDQSFMNAEQLPFSREAEFSSLERGEDSWSKAKGYWARLQSGDLSVAQRFADEDALLREIRSVIISLAQIRTMALAEVKLGHDEELSWRNSLNLFLPLMLVIASAVAIYFATSLLRAIIDPVRELEIGSQKLAAGELSYRVGELSHDELGDLARSFNQMALNLEMSHQTLEGLSNLDYLTGLANVREFYRLFHDESNRAERYQHQFSLVILDVDTFKVVNDTLGHQVGDLVLQEVGRQLRELVRHSDHVARIGGDEFALLLPETGYEHARELAERVRSFFDNHRVEAEQYPELSLRVTLSLGLATYPHDAIEANELFAQADEALYRAKNSGRNRLCMARDRYEAGELG